MRRAQSIRPSTAFLVATISVCGCATAQPDDAWKAPAVDAQPGGGASGGATDSGSSGGATDAGSSGGATDSGPSGHADTGGAASGGDASGAASGGCADASLSCQSLGSVGSYCVDVGTAPPASAADCTADPKSCPSGYDCLTSAGRGYCLEPCAGSAGGSDAGAADTGTDGGGTGGTGGTGTADCSLVKNPSESCCVDDTHALDCAYGGTPIDCSTFGQACGWDTVLGYYTCVDAPAVASPSSSEPRLCGGGTATYDGTVGKACAGDAECQKVSASKAVCSSSTFTGGPRLPTAVCFLSACDPGTDGKVHYCDGPDASTSPGVCIGASAPGVCRAKCQFASDGSAPTGCLANDHCLSYAAGADASGKAFGIGVCSVGCTADAQCPSGSLCDPLLLSCVMSKLAPTLALGDACTSSSSCYCSSGSTTTQGYCIERCVVGHGANDGCPTGWACEAFLPKSLSAGAAGFSTQNAGLLGECRKKCTVGGAACPGASTCKADTVAGPDCQ